MTGTYRLSNAAVDDLYRLWLYGLGMWGEERADRYYADFFRHFDLLAAQPLLYPAVDHIKPGYRRSLCGRDSVYYRIDGNVVEIMAILGQQDTDKWM